MTPSEATTVAPSFRLDGPRNGLLTVHLIGDWSLDAAPTAALGGELSAVEPGRSLSHVEVDASSLSGWDSRMLVALMGVRTALSTRGVTVNFDKLPSGMQGLIRLSQAVPPRGERSPTTGTTDFLTRVGETALASFSALAEANVFLGRSLQSLGRFLRGRARFSRGDLLAFVQATGVQALPIVGVINLLLGVILAFMGAVQLQQFGAQIYVADLVALGQTREIAPMMTAIVMAGRTGAAYAAQLGTMQVNEEIDALRTFGFSPIDFLVLPRMVALALMFPLLVLYADALGILGGFLVGVLMLDLNAIEFLVQTRKAIGIGDILLGLFKGSVFGVLVAVAGCMHGMQSGRSASAVGDAATRAVVSGIIAIIVTTAFFAVLTNMAGF